MKKKGNDERVLLEGANKMAEQMFNFYKENRKFQPYTFGVIGYATELFMRYMCDNGGEDYDQISENYRRFLGAVHDDIKRFKNEDLMVN